MQLVSRIRLLAGERTAAAGPSRALVGVGLVVPLVILAGLADWLFHLDVVIRAALLLALGRRDRMAGLSLRAPPAVRPVRRSRHRLTDRGAVAGLERPAGQHDPVSAADADGDRYGSPALREATVRQAEAEASTIDFREVIEPKPVLLALGLACLGALRGRSSWSSCSPETSRLAMSGCSCRSPATSGRSGRTSCSIEHETTLKVARGDSFRLSVKVRPGDKVPGIGAGDLSIRRRTNRAEPLRSVEGGEFRGPDRVGEPAVSLHGDGRRRHQLDPRRGGQGRAAADLEVARLCG